MTQPEARAEAALDQDKRVETLRIELSAPFISTAPEHVDREIQNSLCRICDYPGFDRSSLFLQPAGDPAAFLLTYVYQRLDMPPLRRRSHEMMDLHPLFRRADELAGGFRLPIRIS